MRTLCLIGIVAMGAFLDATPSFPHLSLYSPEGKSSSLPSGKQEIVFIGRTRRARQSLISWYRIFKEKAEQFPGLPVTVVPVFPSFMANRFLRAPLMILLSQHIPESVPAHVGVLFANLDEMASLFQMEGDEFEQLRIFLVDSGGSILWQGSGGPTASMIRQLTSCLQTHSSMNNNHEGH